MARRSYEYNHNGTHVRVSYNDVSNDVLERILKFIQRHEVWSGDQLLDNYEALEESPELLTALLDEVLDLEVAHLNE